MSPKAKILIVDDNAGMRTSLAGVLEDAGYRVYMSPDGSHALSQLMGEQFNIVIIDIKLPDISGMKVLEAVKEFNPHIEVIIMTAYAEVDTAVCAMNEGAYAYVVKPFNMEELKVIIGRALYQQRLYLENIRLVEELQQSNAELMQANQELKNTQAQLVQAGKLAAIGQLAAGVSHELNNPLGGILGYSQFILDMEKKKELKKLKSEKLKRIFTYVGYIEKESLRCTKIVANLLKFSRSSKTKIAPLDINQVLEETFIFAQNQLEINRV